MDLRKKKNKTASTATVLLMALFTIVLVVGIIKVSGRSTGGASSGSGSSQGSGLQMDKDAQDGPLEGYTASDKTNDEDVLSYRINSKIYYKDGKSPGDLLLENPKENRWMMQLELVLEDGGDLVYSSGYLKPNQHIEAAKLDRELEKGTYPAMAWLYAVDPDTEELIGVLRQPVTLYVEVKKPSK